MEKVHQVVSSERSKIVMPSLATSSSSGYNSGVSVPEGGKSNKSTGESTIVL